MDPVITAELRSCRALIFDLMGTCVDWHSSLRPLLPTVSPRAAAQDVPLEPLLMAWREGFFAEIHRMRAAGLPQEDIDVTHRRLLEALLQERKLYETDGWTEEKKAELVQGWHRQRGWPDSMAGLMRLREKFFVVVLANGTTRLQLDISHSSGLPFHSLFSSQLLGLTKPDPAFYSRVLELLQLPAEACIMVAAHAYDVRAAKTVGMRTIYIQRRTEDSEEDMSAVRADVDWFVDGIDCATDRGGLVTVAEGLGA